MRNTISKTDLRASISKSVSEVFENMLSMQIEVEEPTQNVSLEGGRVMGSVGFGGAVAGVICIHVSEEFSVQMTAAILGIGLEEVHGGEDVNDAIGEITNMIAGNVKAYLSTPPSSCSLSVPSIVRGSRVAIETVSSAEREHFVFSCQNQYVLLELYVKSDK